MEGVRAVQRVPVQRKIMKQTFRNSLAGWLDLKKQQHVRAAPVKANKLTVGLVPISYFPFGLFVEHPNPNRKTRLQPSVRFVLSTCNGPSASGANRSSCTY